MTGSLPGLLLVDDDPLIRDTLAFALGDLFAVQTAGSRLEALDRLLGAPAKFAVALVDLGLPPQPHRPDEGFRLITELLALQPELKVLVLSGQSSDAHARHARTLGALDFVGKPVETRHLRQLLEQACQLSPESSSDERLGGLLGESPQMARLKEQILQFAPSPFPVLVVGESGSGKERVAEALHRSGLHADAPFLALNCAALAPTLIEATLFGHSKGAFTGATAARSGYFEDVGMGTLFLDEMGELPLELQAKLLRVLETGEYQRLGETTPRLSRGRIVAATNRDLRSMSRQGAFRADLFHRLSVLTIEVPPLRELGNDRLVLMRHFRERYARELGRAPFELDEKATTHWLLYGFPGNVRELRNIVIRLMTKYGGQRVDEQRLLEELDEVEAVAGAGKPPLTSALSELQANPDFSLDEALRKVELAYIEAAMQLADGNVSQAARLLGVNRTTLYSRMEWFRREN